MKTVVAVASVLAWACSLGAQITAIPSEDSTAIKIRNDASVSLSAFAILGLQEPAMLPSWCMSIRRLIRP